MRGSGQRLPITLRFTRVLGTFSHTTCFPFSCALWACFSDRSVSGERSEPIGALIPHAALWVVQLERTAEISNRLRRFNAARGFVGGAALDNIGLDTDSMVFQCRTRLCGWCNTSRKATQESVMVVSMPHAALWVVQREMACFANWEVCLFQCRTRLCGWCSVILPFMTSLTFCFNAARGFVGGTATYQELPKWHEEVSMPHAAIPFRPHHRFAVPLPRSRRGGLVTLSFLAESRNISFPRRCGGAVNVCQSHFVLLVFLGRFPIRPVSRSAVPYGLASRTGQ